jgi:hypothetical protein
VAAALALLSTLLVGVLVAFRKNADRIRQEFATRQAVSGTDALLWSWAEQGMFPPDPARGKLPGNDHLLWETRRLPQAVQRTLGLDIVRLQVRQVGAPTGTEPLLVLDLPVPGGLTDPLERRDP